MSKKYFDKNILMTYDKEAICDIAEDKCSMMSNSNMELVKITFELEQQLADHNKLFRSGVLISAMELHTEIEGLEQQLAKYSEDLNIERIKVDTLERDYKALLIVNEALQREVTKLEMSEEDAQNYAVKCKEKLEVAVEALELFRDDYDSYDVNRIARQALEQIKGE